MTSSQGLPPLNPPEATAPDPETMTPPAGGSHVAQLGTRKPTVLPRKAAENGHFARKGA